MVDRLQDFAYSLSDGSITTLGSDLAGADRTVGRLVALLGEPDYDYVVLQRIPEGVHFYDFTGKDVPFLHAAGTAETMIIEWGRYGDGGEWKLSTLFHRAPSDSGQAGGEARFRSDEAAEIFRTYLRTEAPPTGYGLRDHDVSQYR